jgi:DNA-binding PadR family transcriptional regulator
MRRKPGSLLTLELSILSAMARLPRRAAGECHGYQIAKHLPSDSGRRLLTAFGTLYRALGRLEAMGLLESHWEDPQLAANEGRPGRRLYKLTAAGAAAGRVTATADRAVPPFRRRRMARA